MARVRHIRTSIRQKSQSVSSLLGKQKWKTAALVQFLLSQFPKREKQERKNNSFLIEAATDIHTNILSPIMDFPQLRLYTFCQL